MTISVISVYSMIATILAISVAAAPNIFIEDTRNGIKGIYYPSQPVGLFLTKNIKSSPFLIVGMMLKCSMKQQINLTAFILRSPI